MSEPIWIDCASISQVPSATHLATRAQAGRHVVLRFISISRHEKEDLINRLRATLPEHSVFDSGSDREREWVTIHPVVARSRVQERRYAVLRAIVAYRRACESLMEDYQRNMLAAEWQTYEHGLECCFHNSLTGQVVEAPLEGLVDPAHIDPYFFAKFVRSTAGLQEVANLLTHDYHDAQRILNVVTCRNY